MKIHGQLGDKKFSSMFWGKGEEIESIKFVKSKVHKVDGDLTDLIDLKDLMTVNII